MIVILHVDTVNTRDCYVYNTEHVCATECMDNTEHTKWLS